MCSGGRADGRTDGRTEDGRAGLRRTSGASPSAAARCSAGLRGQSRRGPSACEALRGVARSRRMRGARRLRLGPAGGAGDWPLRGSAPECPRSDPGAPGGAPWAGGAETLPAERDSSNRRGGPRLRAQLPRSLRPWMRPRGSSGSIKGLQGGVMGTPASDGCDSWRKDEKAACPCGEKTGRASGDVGVCSHLALSLFIGKNI